MNRYKILLAVFAAVFVVLVMSLAIFIYPNNFKIKSNNHGMDTIPYFYMGDGFNFYYLIMYYQEKEEEKQNSE